MSNFHFIIGSYIGVNTSHSHNFEPSTHYGDTGNFRNRIPKPDFWGCFIPFIALLVVATLCVVLSMYFN